MVAGIITGVMVDTLNVRAMYRKLPALETWFHELKTVNVCASLASMKKMEFVFQQQNVTQAITK